MFYSVISRSTIIIATSTISTTSTSTTITRCITYCHIVRVYHTYLCLSTIGDNHPNIMGQIECCSCSLNIYSIMRYQYFYSYAIIHYDCDLIYQYYCFIHVWSLILMIWDSTIIMIKFCMNLYIHLFMSNIDEIYALFHLLPSHLIWDCHDMTCVKLYL